MSETLSILPGCALWRLDVHTRDQVLTALSDVVIERGFAKPSLRDAVLAREEAYPTGLATPIGSAIPHTDQDHVNVAGFAVATLANPVAFGEMGAPEKSVDAKIVVLLCVTSPQDQVGALSQVLAALSDEDACAKLLAHDDQASFEAAVSAWVAGS